MGSFVEGYLAVFIHTFLQIPLAGTLKETDTKPYQDIPTISPWYPEGYLQRVSEKNLEYPESPIYGLMKYGSLFNLSHTP